jgi:hypothetical protein
MSLAVARAKAVLELQRLGIVPVTASKRRDPASRARYAGDPWAYLSDILGWELTAQQGDALDLIERETRVLIPSGNNLGKTFLLAGYACYFEDAVAAQPDESGREQGARVLLPGPDHPTIVNTIFAEMMAHVARAEARGFPMPGIRTAETWKVRALWGVEMFSPPKSVSQQVAHTASGRHHRNQIALIEEGQGVEERVWRAVEGMCSSAGNKIVSSFNPTEPSGPAYQRGRNGNYRVLHMDAFDHPNVRERRLVVMAAVDFKVIDARVRDCRDRGSASSAQPDPEFGDFVYALPPSLDAHESGPREDGILGHPAGELRIYRPTPAFEAQVRGQYPRSIDTGLFNPGAWDSGVARWRAWQDPGKPPDAVGVDAARTGADDTCAAPRWGEDGEAMLRAWAAAAKGVDEKLTAALLAPLGEAVQWSPTEWITGRRIRVGELRIAPKGTGTQVAEWLTRIWPRSPWNVDEGGVGASVLDHARDVLGVQASGVSFAASPPPPVHEEPWCENTRAALFVRAAMLINRGLVDPPDDDLLREEILAHELVHGSKVVEEAGAKVRKPSVRILEKDEVKKKIGRSPDRADAFVLALWRPVTKGGVWTVSYGE